MWRFEGGGHPGGEGKSKHVRDSIGGLSRGETLHDAAVAEALIVGTGGAYGASRVGNRTREVALRTAVVYRTQAKALKAKC